MKRSFQVWFTILIIFLAGINVNVAQLWENLNPFDQPPGNTLLGVDFPDEEHGWAVGEYGFILHTSDGGVTWLEQGIGLTNFHLNCVYFLDQQCGWVCGDSGLVLHTLDGGRSWHFQPSSTNQSLFGICFIDTKSGWAVGDSAVILHTTDGGNSWNFQSNSIDRCTFMDVCFVDSMWGWIVGPNCTPGQGGLLLRTRNGGKDWEKENSHTYSDLRDVFFTDRMNGWTIGENAVMRTTDGGEVWENRTGDLQKIYGIVAINSETAWVIGEWGLIAHTTDGGITWTYQNSQFFDEPLTENSLYRVHFIDREQGWITGSYGTILFTSDGGKKWYVQRTRISYDMSRGTFANPVEGWFVTHGRPAQVWHTNDGGVNWQMQMQEDDAVLVDLRFTDASAGWVAGVRNSGGGLYDEGFFWRTMDGGESWNEQSTPNDSAIYVVYFFDSFTGWVVGDRKLYHTTDSGQTWQVQVTPGGHVHDFDFLNDQEGWAVGMNLKTSDTGIVFYTTDGGTTWVEQTLQVLPELFAIDFVDHCHGWAVGRNLWQEFICKTDDSGISWDVESFGAYYLNDVYFSDLHTGWIIGAGGLILHSSDGGESWNEMKSGVNTELGRITFLDDDTIGYIFGKDNTLLRYKRPMVFSDCNNDGVTNVLDVIWEINCILGRSQSPYTCDCNDDGIDDVQDVLCIVHDILNFSSLNIEKSVTE